MTSPPPPQESEAAPTPARVAEATRAADRPRRRARTHKREATTRPAGGNESAPRTFSPRIDTAVPELTDMESEERPDQLIAAGLGLLAPVILSGTFLAFAAPLVRTRELQRH